MRLLGSTSSPRSRKNLVVIIILTIYLQQQNTIAWVGIDTCYAIHDNHWLYCNASDRLLQACYALLFDSLAGQILILENRLKCNKCEKLHNWCSAIFSKWKSKCCLENLCSTWPVNRLSITKKEGRKQTQYTTEYIFIHFMTHKIC